MTILVARMSFPGFERRVDVVFVCEIGAKLVFVLVSVRVLFQTSI